MKVELRKISEIVPYSKNAKKHDKTQIANVAESIKQYGFVQPIVIDRDGVIVIGHCRAEAAKKLEMKEVPCVCVDDLTPEQVAALRLVDNKSNESPWDMDLLGEELAELDLVGFEFDWGLPEENVEIIEDEVPEVDDGNPPVAKLGDIWQLGHHRLLCGDSTKEEDIYKLVGGGIKLTCCLQTHRMTWRWVDRAALKNRCLIARNVLMILYGLTRMCYHIFRIWISIPSISSLQKTE